MKRRTGPMVMAALLAVSAGSLSAQRAPRRMGMMAGGERAAGVERLMRMREELELTEQQVQQLDAVRREAVERRSAHQAEIAELRSQLLAGQVERADVRARMEEMRSAAQETRAAERERVEGLLTEEQRATLQEMGARRRAYAAGRRDAMRGRAPGMRGGRWGPAVRMRPGAARGFRGFGPGMPPRAGVAPRMRGGGFGPAMGPGMAPPGPEPGRIR